MKKVLALLIFAFLPFIFALPVRAIATVTFTPASTTLTPNTAAAVDVNLNGGSDPLLGFTFKIDVTGSVPANITLTPATVNNSGNSLELWTNNVVDITGGKRYTLTMVSPTSDTDGYTTNNTSVKMGTFNLTAPASGSITFALATGSEVNHAGTYANLLTSLTSKTYTVEVEPEPTITVQPTAIPTAVPTAPTQNGTINLNFRLQGMTTAINMSGQTTLTLKNATNNSTISTVTPTNLTASNNGVFSYTFTNVPRSLIKVCIKSASHLQVCTDANKPNRANHVNLSTNATATLNMSDHSANEADVGDLNHDNQITQTDMAMMSSAYYPNFINPVPSNCPQCDINRDNRITVDDLSLVMMNVTDFVIGGDE